MILCNLKDTSKTTDVDMDNLVDNTNHNPEASEVDQNTDKEDITHISTILKGITFVDSPLIFSGMLPFSNRQSRICYNR